MKGWIFTTLMPFLAGIVLAINLEQLIPTNENYDAQWWKVILAVVAGLIGPIIYNRTRS